MKLSIIVPAYNEEDRLGPMLEDYTRYFAEKYGRDVEFIVVVNGSTDRTAQVANAGAQKCPQVRAIIEPRRVGKGGAIMMGMKAAVGDFVGFVDADNATPPDAFQDLVEHIGDAGAIIASRWLPGARVSPRQPLRRRVASRIFNFLVRRMFQLSITDTQCGAKLMKGEAARAVLPLLGLTRWAFDVDLLFQLRRRGYPITEWPTTWHDQSGSRLKVARVSLEMFAAICRLRILYSPLRWIVTIYDRTVGPFFHLKV
ncbi:MAG: dolichyl-phosphate beta-glucosyltransferase [Verrucomicrobiota bacterium]